MNKADEKALAGLHGKLAEVLQEAISKDYLDPETGEKLPPPAAILNVARQFLKDNKIEAIAAEGSPLAGLADLPVFEDDENVIPFKANQK
jgi:hypothetical protein